MWEINRYRTLLIKIIGILQLKTSIKRKAKIASLILALIIKAYKFH